MLVLGLAVGLLALAKLGLSQGTIETVRMNEGPDAMHGVVLRCWVFTALGAAFAIAGVLLMYLNPKGGELTTSHSARSGQLEASSIASRLGAIQSLLDEGVVSEAEYQEQRRRILDQT